MDQVREIRHRVLVKREGVRAVARELGISRNTVRRYLALSEPKRIEAKPRRRPRFEAVSARLEELFNDWSTRTTKKQRITGTRLHRQLLDEGLQAGTSLVRAFLREKRRLVQEVFIPLEHAPGDSAQVDFFEATVEIRGVRQRIFLFLMRLMHSGSDFVWLYERCDQLSFLDGHVRAFQHFGAVPRRCVYDNLSAAVKRRVGWRRELTDAFARLVSHYLFEPCFARVGVGHDKGGVEARGKGIRLQELVPIPRGDSLEEIAALVLAGVERRAEQRTFADGTSHAERVAADRRAMLALPEHGFVARRHIPVTVRSTARIRIDAAWYSVPSAWARCEADVFLGVQDLVVRCRGEEVVLPKIRPGGSRIEYRHYVRELATKPHAVRQVSSSLLQELGPPFDQLWQLLVETHGERQAARTLADVLGAVHAQGEAPVREALEAALARGRIDLLALERTSSPTVTTVPVPERLAHYAVESIRASAYDALLVGGVA